MQRSVSLFGDPAVIDISFSGAAISGVRVVSTKYPRVHKFVEAVDRNIKAGKSLHEQKWNIVAVMDLINELMDAQDELADCVVAETAA